MALSKSQATAIVEVVAAHPPSIARIQKDPWRDSALTHALPDSWGATGASRNWRLVLTGRDPTDPAIAATVCTGIADSTMEALTKALNGRPGALPGVKSINVLSRNGTLGTDHTATLIVMADGTEYVFDWHATLNPRNPMISKKRDWLDSRGGITYVHFTGFAR